MGNYYQILKNTLSQRKISSEGIHIADIRLSRCVYYMAYAIELIFFSVRGLCLPVGVKVFGINGWTIIQLVHMIASLVVMLLWSEKFKPLLRGSAVIMLAGLVPYVFMPVGYLRFLFGLIGYAGLGGVVTGARCGYAFASNNAERFFGIIFVYFSVMFVKLAHSQWTDGVFMTHILPLVLLTLLCLCIYKFREEDFEVKDEATKLDAKGLYWAFAFFIVYFIIDGYIGDLADSSLKAEYLFTVIGIAITDILLTAVFCGLHFSTWHLWNLFFFLSIGMGLFAVLAPRLGSLKPMHLFCGLTYMGWPLCIYTMGCAQRRFASYQLLKKCTLIYVILSVITKLPGNILADLAPDALPLVTLCITVTTALVMFMLSPFSYRYLFSSIWISDLYKSDMVSLQKKVEEVDRFEKYGLTPRQKEVAVLLLAAKTRRQIAGELGLSESTVKMHTAELFRRLNINSRVELFRLFGVAEDADPVDLSENKISSISK